LSFWNVVGREGGLGSVRSGDAERTGTGTGDMATV